MRTSYPFPEIVYRNSQIPRPEPRGDGTYIQTLSIYSVPNVISELTGHLSIDNRLQVHHANLRNGSQVKKKIGNILMPYVVLEHHMPSRDSRHSILMVNQVS